MTPAQQAKAEVYQELGYRVAGARHGAAPAADRRRAELAKIHVLAKQLRMQEGTYREMLGAVAGVRSAKDLDESGRRRVIERLRRISAPARSVYPGRPANIDSEDRGPQLRKIEAQLTYAKRPWAYADAIARRMFGVSRVGFCNSVQLGKIIAALAIDSRRRAHG